VRSSECVSVWVREFLECLFVCMCLRMCVCVCLFVIVCESVFVGMCAIIRVNMCVDMCASE